jgi:co-chaperonin GroES (HSP10)
MIKPVNNNLLIKIIENETVTKQGLIIKNDKNEDIKRGKIIKISDDIVDNNLKENIEIIFNSEDSNKIFYDNQNYILIDKDKILGIIE